MEDILNLKTEGGAKPFWKKKAVLISGVTVVVVLLFVGGVAAYGKTLEGRVLPGVSIGSLSFGGMTEAEVANFLETMNEKLSKEGIAFVYDNGEVHREGLAYPLILPDEGAYPVVSLDAVQEAERLVNLGGRNHFSKGIFGLYTRFVRPSFSLKTVTVDKNAVAKHIEENFGEYEHPFRNANIMVSAENGVSPQIVTSTPGAVFDRAAAEEELKTAWSKLIFPTVHLRMVQEVPSVLDADAKELLGDAEKLLLVQEGMMVSSTDPHTKEKLSFSISFEKLLSWAEVIKENDKAFLGLSKEKAEEYLALSVAPKVEAEPMEARFQVGEGNKVEVFQGSRPGVKINTEETYAKMNEAFAKRGENRGAGAPETISLVMEVVEPNTKTGDVNSLGIKEVLGIGYSNFSGSPTNRIKNIRFAVEQKLNGLLIKPEETFSLLAALRPFTLEGGYLPELVIKGNEIIPEIGGGLCQVGSTMFRTAMNTGLPIVERVNHGLVVSYYNDHRNGLPGTDATIYDAAPDFRFKNDTGHYILLTTEMDTATGDLRFTFWGTSDGRKGSYTPPVLHHWIAAGPDQETKTTSLAPGKKECKSVHTGAVASFTYTIQKPDGTKIDRVFESHYRPLPRICLVGATQEEIDADKAAAEAVPGPGEAESGEGEAPASGEETPPSVPSQSPLPEVVPFE